MDRNIFMTFGTGCDEAELTARTRLVYFKETRCDISCMCFVYSCAQADMSGNRLTGERHSLCVCSKNIEKHVCTVFSVSRKLQNSIHIAGQQQTEDFNSAREAYACCNIQIETSNITQNGVEKHSLVINE